MHRTTKREKKVTKNQNIFNLKQTSINLELYKPLYDRTQIIIYAFLPVLNNTAKSSKYHSLYLTHPDTCVYVYLDGGYCVVMPPPPNFREVVKGMECA